VEISVDVKKVTGEVLPILNTIDGAMKGELKGQSHEIFELRFFSSNISP
jgi:hypothetical protein